MEIWTVVGVDTKAIEKIKSTGESVSGVKYHVHGANFDSSDPDRCLGECVSVIFLSHDERERFKYDAMPGDQIRVAYNRWGKITVFEPVL